jgi:iron(III) transport system substrate-binding protein
MRSMLAALAALAVVACLVPAPVRADWKDTPAVKALYEQAKKEGQVVIWGPSRRELEWIPAGFGKLFPGITVDFVGDNDVATRAIAEARGGRHAVDTFWNSVTATMPLIQRNLMAPVDWAPYGLGKEATAFDDKMAYAHTVAYVVAFEKGAVAPQDAPTDWAQLLEPRYRGKMVGSLFLLPRLVGGLSLAWGEARALQYARDLVRNTDFMLTKAPRETFLKSGERRLAAGEIDATFRRFIMEGQAFDFSIPEPIVLVQFGPTVLAKAPHPNAARLLAGYLASPEGKAERLSATGQIDYGLKSDAEIAKKIHSGQVKVVFDLPSNQKEREEVIRKAGPIIAGQAQ